MNFGLYIAWSGLRTFVSLSEPELGHAVKYLIQK